MTLSPAILDSQEYARRLVLKLDGSVLPYDEDIGGFVLDTATPIFVTRGTATARAALSGDPGQLFYETDTSVLLEWTNAAAWKAVAAPGAWTSASYPTPANTDAAYEGLRVYETDTGKTVVFRRTTLGVGISGGNPLIWIQVSPVTTTGIDITGVGTTASPFVGAVRNRQQLANPVRNASMAVAQRGTSIAVGAGSVYTLDGWKAFRNAFAVGMTVSQQTTLADTQGSGYAMRVQRDSANAALDSLFIQQSIPTIDSRRFAGRTVAFSFRVRKGANFSPTSGTVSGSLITGTGTDQTLSGAFTGQATVVTISAAATSNWVTWSGTATLGAGTTQLGVQFSCTPVGTAGVADYFEVKDVRIDEGAYAQEHVPPPYAQDLAECQRFFWRCGGVATDNIGHGQVNATNGCVLWIRHPAPMRANAALTVTNAAQFTVNDVSVSIAASTIALDGGTSQTVVGASVIITTTLSTLTVARIARVYAAATGYLDFSAEI